MLFLGAEFVEALSIVGGRSEKLSKAATAAGSPLNGAANPPGSKCVSLDTGGVADHAAHGGRSTTTG